MTTFLKKHKDGTFDVVSANEIKEGTEFLTKYDKPTVTARVVNVNVSRKEKGILKDESNRRNWANVSVQYL